MPTKKCVIKKKMRHKTVIEKGKMRRRNPISHPQKRYSYLVEVFQNAGKAGEDTFRDTGKDSGIAVTPSLIGEGSECLDDGYKKGSKANRSERCSDSSNKGIANSLRTASRLFRGNPLPIDKITTLKKHKIE
jgi:hypothetical protein